MDSLGSTPYGLHDLIERLSTELAKNAQIQEPLAISESTALRICPILERCLQLIDNEKHTTNFRERHFVSNLKMLQTLLTSYKESHQCSDELLQAIEQVLRACKRPPTESSNFHLLPNDVLIQVFQKHLSFTELVKWGQICKKCRQIVMQPANWQGSQAFQNLVSQPFAVELQSQFLSLLATYAKKPETIQFSKQLATLFFNSASDSVLKEVISNRNPELVRHFLQLLQVDKLQRTSLKMWPAKAAQAEALATYNSFLSYLFALEELDLKDLNRLERKEITLFQSLANLRVLKMANASVTGEWLTAFERSHSSLETIELAACTTLRGKDIGCIGTNTALRNLCVKATSFLVDQDFAFLQQLSRLETIDTERCQSLKGTFLKYLVSSAAQLTELCMAGCKNVTDEGLAHLPICPKLHTFVLSQSQVTDSGIRTMLKKASQLQVLDLGDLKKLTGSLLFDIGELKRLRELNCTGWKADSETTFESLSTLTNLETLTLRNFRGFTGQGLQNCTFPKLQRLVLADSSSFNPEYLRVLPRAASNLQTLDLSNIKLTGTQLECLGGLSQLVELDMTRCHLNDADIQPLEPLFQNLQKLYLAGNALTDSSASLFAKANRLEQLDISSNTAITARFLQVVGKITSLKHLDITGCPEIEAEAIDALMQARPDLIIRFSPARTTHP